MILFLKRIAELLRWGVKLNINNRSNQFNDNFSIKSTCADKKYQEEGSWENELCRYFLNINQKQSEFESTERNAELVDLLNIVNNNCADLKEHIKAHITQVHQARYLIRLVNSLQYEVEARVLGTTSVSTEDTTTIPYKTFTAKTDFKLFSISLFPIQESEIKNINIIKVDGQKITPMSTYDKTTETLTYHNIPNMSDNKHYYSNISIISTPNKASLVTNWTSNPKNNSLMTLFNVENQHFASTYHFQMKSKNTVVVKFERTQNKNAISTISEAIVKPDTKGIIKFTTSFSGNAYADVQEVKMTLILLLPGGAMNPATIQAEVIQTPSFSLYVTGERLMYKLEKPIFQDQPQMKTDVSSIHPSYIDSSLLAQSLPLWTIVSVKTSTLGSQTYLTHTYQYLPFRFIYGVLTLIMGAIVGILFIPYIIQLLAEIIRLSQLRSVHGMMYAFAENVKFGLLVLLLLFFMIDLMFLSRTFEPIYILVVFILWFCLEVFKPDHRDMILVSLFIFFGVIIAPHYKNEQKFGVWSFMILFTSVIYALITSVKEEHKSLPSVAMSFFMPKLTALGLILKRKGRYASNRIMQIARRYYVSHPQTTTHYIQNGLFFFILFVLIGSISLTSYTSARFVKHQIELYKELQQELLIHPVIYTIEPELGYFGTKVILRGDRFGWLEHDRVNLTIDGQPLKADLWTNEKIIFTIPIEWQTGTKKISVLKKTKWKNKSTIAQSNVVHFQLLERSATINKLDEKYMNSIKNWSNEAKKINGYEE
jgi:hypothetical protein